MGNPDQRSAEAEQYRRLYKTARWRQTRDRQLRAQPLCQRCRKRGALIPATVCHHIDKASKADPSTFFAGPFESLCAPCHDGDAQKQEIVGYSSVVDASGWPDDPNHPINR